MKILQVNNFHYPRGGSDRYFLEISNLLRESGHSVRTFSTNHRVTHQKDLALVNLPNGVDTDRIGSPINILKYLYSPEARQYMIDGITEFNPDIAHLHIYYGQLTASILAPLRKAGIPIVANVA